jgi:hypothetical protein
MRISGKMYGDNSCKKRQLKLRISYGTSDTFNDTRPISVYYIVF